MCEQGVKWLYVSLDDTVQSLYNLMKKERFIQADEIAVYVTAIECARCRHQSTQLILFVIMQLQPGEESGTPDAR